MKKSISILELEFILGQMKSLQKEHPKAKVLFDIERHRIEITYPLPKDFVEAKGALYTFDQDFSHPKEKEEVG